MYGIRAFLCRIFCPYILAFFFAQSAFFGHYLKNKLPTYPTFSRTLSYIYYAQSTDLDDPRILLCKPQTRALRNNPKIVFANLRSKVLLRKPRIHMQSTRIAKPNLSHPRQQTHDRSHKQNSSAIHSNKATIDRTSKAARPSTEKKPRLIAYTKQLGQSCANLCMR